MPARAALERKLGHLVFGSRRWLEREVRLLAGQRSEARVLEIGSGRQDMGEDAYSMRDLFPPTAEFVQSDVNPDFGHRVIDITTMDIAEEFDVILCLSVLEHIPTFQEAPPRLYRALCPGGVLMVSTPMCFPYHDEPADYWRLTEHGMRAVLAPFDRVEVRHRGVRRLPFTVMGLGHRAR